MLMESARESEDEEDEEEEEEGDAEEGTVKALGDGGRSRMDFWSAATTCPRETRTRMQPSWPLLPCQH